MRRLSSLTAAFILALPALAAAQGEPPKPDTAKKAEIVTHFGMWRGVATVETGAQEVWLSLKKNGDQLVGTAGSQMGEVPLYDITVKGDTLTAGATMATPNGNFDLFYWLLLKDKTLAGSIDLNIQGQKMSIPVSFTKQP